MKNDSYSQLPEFHFAKVIRKNHSKKNLRCLIFGNFGAMNVGDEAILKGELSELATIPSLSVTVVARFPQEIKRIHKIKGISLFAFASILRELRKTDFVIIGGGGIICKADRGIIGYVYQLYMLLIFFYLPKIYRRRIYVLGIGFYANAHGSIRQLAVNFMRSASIVTVRDRHSLNTLTMAGIKPKFYKDNSFLMDLLPVKEIKNEPIFKPHFKRNRVNIGISLKRPTVAVDEEKLIKELLKFVDKTKNYSNYWFFPCDYHSAYFNDEHFGKLLAQKIYDKFGKKVVFVIVPPIWGPQKFFSSFAVMDFLITMRFHADVFAFRLGIPYIGIPYDLKCSSILKSTNAHMVDINDISGRKLVDVFIRTCGKARRLYTRHTIVTGSLDTYAA